MSESPEGLINAYDYLSSGHPAFYISSVYPFEWRHRVPTLGILLALPMRTIMNNHKVSCDSDGKSNLSVQSPKPVQGKKSLPSRPSVHHRVQSRRQRAQNIFVQTSTPMLFIPAFCPVPAMPRATRALSCRLVSPGHALSPHQDARNAISLPAWNLAQSLL